MMREQLECIGKDQRIVHHVTGISPHVYTNSAVFCCAYTVLILEKTIEEAYTPFLSLPPLIPFRDITFDNSKYNIIPYDAISALCKASEVKMIDIYTFDVDEYLKTYDVENGDITWIIPNKMCVFSTPNLQQTELWNGKYSWGVKEYSDYFHEKGVTDIIRLEEADYNINVWNKYGFNAYEYLFTTGEIPSQRVEVSFFNITDKPKSVVAISCNSGLGRSCTLIAAYIIKHYHFTANEAIMYIRMLRPGAVYGPQQKYLAYMEEEYYKQVLTYL